MVEWTNPWDGRCLNCGAEPDRIAALEAKDKQMRKLLVSCRDGMPRRGWDYGQWKADVNTALAETEGE